MLTIVRARAPRRTRTAARVVFEATVNRTPAALFAASRNRYQRRLQTDELCLPPGLLKLAAFRRRIPDEVTTFNLLGRPGLRMARVDSLSTRVLYWTGTNWISQFAAGVHIWEKLCSRAANVLEIGANIGYYTIAGGFVAAGKYTAVEPHPRSCAALRMNLHLNGLSRVDVLEAAVVPDSDSSSVELLCPIGSDYATPAGAMVKNSAFDGQQNRDATESLTVAAVPFESIVAGRDLVKLDVEGLEASLLMSAWAALVRTAPALMIEIHDYASELRELMPRLLADLDATAFAMGRDALVPMRVDDLQTGELHRRYHTWDYLIVPRAKIALTDGLVRPRPVIRKAS